MKFKTMLILMLFYMAIALMPVKAQGDVPSNPVNLSFSGSTLDPTFVFDEQGTIHVIWMDEFSGILYSSYNGEVWGKPSTVTFPFEHHVPTLVQGGDGKTYAFWINEEGELWYSLVASTKFGAAEAWVNHPPLNDSVLSFDVVVDEQGGIHLVYIQAAETKGGQPGIYYKSFAANGTGWQPSVSLYQSKYFRATKPEDANVQIKVVSAQEGPEIYAVWDDRMVKSVFFSRSGDGGLTWEAPVEIAGPQVLKSPTTAYSIRLLTKGDNILLVYQNGQPRQSCIQSYLYSKDKGKTWSVHKRMLEEFAGCAQENRFLEPTDGDPVLWTYIQEQVYLSAWDGAQWSQPQNYTQASTFEDPKTRILITLNNPKSKMGPKRTLYIVGSDTQRGDVWWNKIELKDTAGWFGSKDNWSELEVVTSGAKEALSVALTADKSNQIHAFWSQSSGNLNGTPDSAIYYSRWENEQLWSFPIKIQSADQVYSDQPSVTIDPAGDLCLVWKAGPTSEIYFSHSPSNLAALSSSWSEPLLVSIPGHQAESPEIQVDAAGKLYVVYAVPINEERGIYLTTSSDGGQTWSASRRVISSQELGHAWVNNPHFRISGNGMMHLVWTNYQIVSGHPQPVSMLYSRSTDGGETWSSSETISSQPYSWSSLMVTGNSAVHRLWQEFDGSDLNIWDEYSLDDGNTWERVKPFSFFGSQIGVPGISTDPGGRLHLLQIIQLDVDRYTLQHVIWDGDSWENQDAKDLSLELVVSLGSPAAVVSNANNLGVVFPAVISDPQSNGNDMKLIYTHLLFGDLQQVGLEEAQPLATDTPVKGEDLPPTAEVQPLATSIAVEGEDLTPTAEVQPLATATTGMIDNSRSPSNSSMGIVVGTISSALFVIVVAAGLFLRNRLNR